MLERDLLARGVDILDYHRGQISPRRMDVLINGLLRDESSETYREASGEAAAEWTLDRHFLAGILNTLRLIDYHLVVSYAREPEQVERPEMVPAPGVGAEASSTGSAERGVDTGKGERFRDALLAIPAADLNDVKAFAADNGAVPSA